MPKKAGRASTRVQYAAADLEVAYWVLPHERRVVGKRCICAEHQGDGPIVPTDTNEYLKRAQEGTLPPRVAVVGLKVDPSGTLGLVCEDCEKNIDLEGAN